MVQMLSSKDVNFMGYTYKNFEIVNEHEVPGIGAYFSPCLHNSLHQYFYICCSFCSLKLYHEDEALELLDGPNCNSLCSDNDFGNN